MDQEQAVTAKDAMEAVRALNEMMGMFNESQEILTRILPKFVEAGQGNGVAMFEGMGMIGDLDLDQSQGTLIVAATLLAKIVVASEGTPCEEIINEIRKGK